MAKKTSRDDLKQRRKSPLVTPTDLKPAATRDIAGGMNAILADVFAMYLKTKNFHWHMSGPHFRDYHLMLDEQGDQIFASIDPLAERVRKIGKPTLRSIAHVAELTRVEDSNAEFVPPLKMLGELLADNKAMAAAMREAHELCEKQGDSGSASLLETYIDETERRTWFLFEAARGADASGH